MQSLGLSGRHKLDTGSGSGMTQDLGECVNQGTLIHFAYN
jgi:hypothetical protein